MPRLPSRSRISGAAILITGVLLAAGCHRSHYREQADGDAYSIVHEKAMNPHWNLPRQTIEIDPRSRMFDPFDRDRPPMPPDDPTAHELMHYVDDKKGYPRWHANGDVDTTENPDWMAFLPLDENGVLNITADEAYQLALIHSRDYQQQFENLYLSALDVSAERFRFNTQFFGGYQTTADARGDGSSDLTASTYSTAIGRSGIPAGGVAVGTLGSAGGRGTNDLTARRSFATGADLIVGVANSLVWTFDGSDTLTPTTVFNAGFIQPLLRRAGRDRIMEQLTLSERTVLANVRQMERYRGTFYVSIMTGRDPGSGASRRGGVFGSGLEGFTGVGGGFGGVGGGGGGGISGGNSGGTGAAAAGGYYGLLQTQQGIRNQQVTIAGLRSNLATLRESLRESLTKIPDDPETLLRDRLQIAQARQALLNSESALLNSQAGYQATLDNFKRTLGLPPQLCVNIKDDMLDQFNLISPETIRSQAEVSELRADIGRNNDQILALLQPGRDPAADPAAPAQAVWSDELAEQLRTQRELIDRVRKIYQGVAAGTLPQTRKDIERLVDSLADRKRDLLGIKTKYKLEIANYDRYGRLDPCGVTLLADIDASVYDVEALEAVPAKLNADAIRLEAQFNSYAEPLAAIEKVIEELLAVETKPSGVALSELLEQKIVFATPSLLSELSEDILDVSLVQARARTHTVRVTPIELKWDTAVELARRYRHDWMNARTSLVDAWRLIEFNADNLEGILDLEANARTDTHSNEEVRMALKFDAPITRLTERNTYRQSLIEYQQAKRSYYAYVDGVTQSLRNTLRTIDLNRVNFEERRVAVLSAIDQVVLNDQIQKLREERGQEAGVTAARDVVSALGDLQQAQTDFLNVWVNYEVQRLNLDVDLGTMNLDSEGNWIDPGPVGGQYGLPAPIDFVEDEAGFVFELPAEPELLPNPQDQPSSELPAPMPAGDEARSSSRRNFAPQPQPPEPQLPMEATSPVVPASFDPKTKAPMARLPVID